MPIAYSRLCDEPTTCIEVIGRGVRVEVSYRGRVIAHLTRLPWRAEAPTGIDVVSVAELRRGKLARAELLRQGARFAVAVHGRAVAVVEGVRP